MQDPTEFRKRFQLYKEGKMPYENGLPKYEDGKVNWPRWDNAQITSYTIPFIEGKAIKLTNAGRATGAVLSTNLLDSLADNAMRAGIPVRTAIGLATKESTLGNPTDDRSAWNLSSRIRKQFNEVYPGTVQHINDGTNLVDGIKLINYHKGDINHEMFNGTQGKSIIQEGLEFYKTHPDKYNPGQKGYQKAVDARGDEVMNSPEVKKWYKEWEAKQVRVMRPKPYKIETSIQNTAAPKFGSWKNGKLPGYKGGKIGHNVSHAEMNNDGTFTDDYTKLFEDMYVTPQKTDLKRGSYTLNNFPYYLQHRTDWMKPFMSSGTNEKGLELISPEFDLLLGGRQLATELIPNITRSKLASNISSAIGSPSQNPFKYKTNETAADLFTKMKKIQIRGDLSKIKSDPVDIDNDPYGIRSLSSGVIHHESMPEGVEDIFRYQILPRTNISKMNYNNTIDVLSRYGYNTLDDYNWAKYVDDNLAGYLDNNTLAIALREPNVRYAAPHEFRHRMQQLVKDKPSLAIDRKSYLDNAYGDDFVNLPNTVDESDHLFGYPHMSDEAATTNLDSRIYAFSNFTDNPNIGKMSVVEQNKFLDSLSDDQIIEAVANSNGYGRRYIPFLEKKYDILNDQKAKSQWANKFRNAMKYYGSFALPTAIVASLPEYSNGKSPIHIKPANRGKFTALKKRTGHSASWFKAHGTPAQKKMAVFALNAKKWKH